MPKDSLFEIPLFLNCQENLLPSIALTSDKIIRPFEEIEKEVIVKAIEYCDGNIEKTAKLLKLGAATIHRKKKQWKSDKTVLAGIQACH